MEIYHVLNRGVDKRKIFMDDQDRFRFIHDLYEFNDQDWVNSNSYYFNKNPTLSLDLRGREIGKKKRKLLVDIHAFCIMPNHYHLLLSPRVQDGVSRFMRKMNMGYAKYFNQKYQRKGALFESRYKSVHVKDEPHFIHILYYIHLNPLDLIAPEWRDRTIKNYEKTFEFLENYRWSSFHDYIGKKNFSSVTSRGFFTKYHGGLGAYKKETSQWLADMNSNVIDYATLE